MFPSFTGSSRKPRRVDLSGRKSTPQNKQIPGLSTQSYQHSSALLLAQQQRAKREAERKELEAVKTIQRTWRGKSDLSRIRTIWRSVWDNKYGRQLAGRKVRDIAEATSAIRLFLAFFDRTWRSGRLLKRIGPRQPGDDLQRLAVLVEALTVSNGSMLHPHLISPSINFQDFFTLHRFVALLLSTIHQSSSASSQLVIIILHLIAELPIVALSVIEGRGFSFSTLEIISPTYYQTLSHLTSASSAHSNPELRELLLRCLLGPLSVIPLPESVRSSLPTNTAVYRAFSRFYLTTPSLGECLGPDTLEILASKIHIGVLTRAVLENLEEGDQISRTTSLRSRRLEQKETSSNKAAEDRNLWLLAYIIFFFRKNSRNVTSRSRQDGNSYIKCITLLFGDAANDVGTRIDLEDQEMSGSGISNDPLQMSYDYENEMDIDGDGSASQRKVPLPGFIKQELHTLIDQPSISSLLSGTPSIMQISGQTSEGVEAQLLASYALTLLLVFPKQIQELRMWLYLASTSDGVPAVRYLWEAVKRAKLFADVSSDVSAAVDSLKKKRKVQTNSESTRGRAELDLTKHQRQYQQYQGAITGKGDKVETGDDDDDWRVILLFLELYSFLLIVMDDEDFFNAGKNNSIGGGEGSRTRDSAPPLKDVMDLTIFLKNLAFAMYWYTGEIMREGQRASVGDIPNGAGVGDANTDADELEVAGVKGMGFSYVKGLVTNLLRMVYLRDSRRRFLPQNHWLMTSRFDMEGFIPAVVAEEENRHKLEAEEEENEPDSQEFPGQVDSRFQRMHKHRQRQQKNHHLAAVAPRLEILQHLPFFIPFDTRVQIFREFVSVDQRRRRGGNTDPDAWRAIFFSGRRRHGDAHGDAHTALSKHHATIRRESVFEDAFTEFYPLGDGLKEPIQITFIDQFGAQEAGIDGGGVTKEFLTSVTKEAFVPERYNLFLENKHHMLYPNPNSIEELREGLREEGLSPAEIDISVADLLNRYEFLGRIVGKCIYEEILVDISFTGVFLLQWSYGKDGGCSMGNGYRPGVNDLKDLDEELYQGLVALKNYTGDVETDFALNFTINSSLTLPNGKSKTITIDLKPNGANIPVTNSDRLTYIHLVSKYRLVNQPRAQINAFLKGLGSIIQPSWLSMFNQSELQTLVGGGDSPIDVADLRRNTVYGGLYVIGDDGVEHPVIQMFWKVMEEDLNDDERRRVLKFVTSVSRAPLLGFGMLYPRFSIRDSGDDQERLPSTSTCVNLMKLPRYNDRKTMKKKLLYAVNAGAGFDLS